MSLGSEISLQVFCQNLSQVCCPGWRLRLLTGFVRLWLTEHFSLVDRIEDDLLKKRVWKPTDNTGILIESVTRWQPQLTEKRPALIIKRNKLNVLRQGINDKLMMGTGVEGTKQKYTTFLQGSHTVFCIAGESGEAEVLANEALRELIHFSVVLRPNLALHKLMVTEVGDLSLLEEASENFVVPITLAYAYEEAWEITQPVPTINSISLNILQS